MTGFAVLVPLGGAGGPQTLLPLQHGLMLGNFLPHSPPAPGIIQDRRRFQGLGCACLFVQHLVSTLAGGAGALCQKVTQGRPCSQGSRSQG